jgi:hypothetical protein
MSKFFSPAEWTELRRRFETNREAQLTLVAEHELTTSYSSAFLALWAALEHFAKSLGPAAYRKELKTALSEWLEYVDGSRVNMPSEIGAEKFNRPYKKAEKIPPETLMQKLLPEASATTLYLVLAPKKKHRIRRNDIAHKGVITSQKVYEEFKGAAVAALSEIELWLSRGPI